MRLTRSECLEKLRDILLTMDACAPQKAREATEATRLTDELGLDSVGMLYLVIVIEQAFSIRFDDVGVARFQTVGDVLDYIEEQMK